MFFFSFFFFFSAAVVPSAPGATGAAAAAGAAGGASLTISSAMLLLKGDQPRCAGQVEVERVRACPRELPAWRERFRAWALFGYGRWCACAGHEPEGLCGDEGHGSSPGPSGA